ncbi:MAG TPA: PaaI family thioesterase [Candidatus Nitrosotalea sp.]|nr:PaaI family thioesterase [Candidatus Nitrosotalea sp.]
MPPDPLPARPPSGYERLVGLEIVSASPQEVLIELEVGPEHLQPAGIVHGGVYCGMVETAASIGAQIEAQRRGLTVAGIENSTSFVRSVRSGRLRARATPVTRGRTTQLWQVEIQDATGRVVASGRVRLLNLEQGAGS